MPDPLSTGDTDRELPAVPPPSDTGLTSSTARHAAIAGAPNGDMAAEPAQVWKGRALTAAAVGGPFVSFAAGLTAGDPKEVVREIALAVQGPFGALVFAVVVCAVTFFMLVKIMAESKVQAQAWRETVVHEGRKWRELVEKHRDDCQKHVALKEDRMIRLAAEKDKAMGARDEEIKRLNEERVADARHFGEQLQRLIDYLPKGDD